MTNEEYFRAMAHLALAMKAITDNYNEGPDEFRVSFHDGTIFFNNGKQTLNWFHLGSDIDNAPIYVSEDGYMWIEEDEF